LNIEPELGTCSSIHDILVVGQERWSRDLPLVTREEQQVGSGGVHLVRLSGMDRFLLDSLDLQGFKFLIKDLGQIHSDRLVDLLPQMGSEDLDKRDLERWDFTMPLISVRT
jgi:hypothetical protein